MKKKLLRVAVIGASGRMGAEIAQVLSQTNNCEAFVGVSRAGRAPGFQYGCKDFSSAFLKQADVWIDFSAVSVFSQVLKAAVRLQKPLVSGTTGLSKAQTKAMHTASRQIPLLWAPNMSFGVAALKKALAIAADLRDFDFQIEEFHHRHKKDKPSGTALALQEKLIAASKKKCPPPVSIRGGGIFGVHKIWMMDDDEVICFEHQALNRRVFAKGAVRAAQWLPVQAAGLYGMEDLFSKK